MAQQRTHSFLLSQRGESSTLNHSGSPSVGDCTFVQPSCSRSGGSPLECDEVSPTAGMGDILPLGDRTRRARERTAMCVPDVMRLSSGSTKGSRGRGVTNEYYRTRPRSTLRYYRVALTLVLNRGKLWVKGLLHLLGSQLFGMPDAFIHERPRYVWNSRRSISTILHSPVPIEPGEILRVRHNDPRSVGCGASRD